MGGLSTGIFIFGTVMIYGMTGETNIYNIREILNYMDTRVMEITSFIIVFSLIFKLGGAPFHV